MTHVKYVVTTLAAALIAFAHTSMAQAPSSAIGMVIMHGKGLPTRHVSSLASSLEQKGYLVANLEMPWSANREYDAGVEVAEKVVDAALDSLRAKGAGKVFIPGTARARCSRFITAAGILRTASSLLHRAGTSQTPSSAKSLASPWNRRASSSPKGKALRRRGSATTRVPKAPIPSRPLPPLI